MVFLKFIGFLLLLTEPLSSIGSTSFKDDDASFAMYFTSLLLQCTNSAQVQGKWGLRLGGLLTDDVFHIMLETRQWLIPQIPRLGRALR
jgi:hypothetical protein